MNILLINIPSRRGEAGFMLPLGLIYVGGIIERAGHVAKIMDPYLDDIELRSFDNGEFFKKVDAVIEDFKPSMIGFSGISTAYGRAKLLSLYVKERYPELLQIVGRPLSSVHDLLLTKAKVDAVFHGEAEVSLPIFLKSFERGESYHGTPGISYLLDGKVIKNSPAELIDDLDTIPLPSYHLVDMEKYFHTAANWMDNSGRFLENNPNRDIIMKNIGDKKYYLPIVTSRGCTHTCLFCYRHVKGIRQHIVAFVIEHIKYIKDNYGVDGFQFSDELFNTRPEWVFELCDAIETEGLDIFYIIAGARIDKVSEKMLYRLRDTGCIEIGYGHESGSDIILEEYGKGITAKQNREMTILTTNVVGLNSPVQLVIGAPSETPETIKETIQLLKDVDAYEYSFNYLIPLPQTPIWDYVQKNNLIDDLEGYLDLVAERGGEPIVNLTKMSDDDWKGFVRIFRREMGLYHCRKKSYLLYLLLRVVYGIEKVVAPVIPMSFLRKILPLWVRRRF